MNKRKSPPKSAGRFRKVLDLKRRSREEVSTAHFIITKFDGSFINPIKCIMLVGKSWWLYQARAGLLRTVRCNTPGPSSGCRLTKGRHQWIITTPWGVRLTPLWVDDIKCDSEPVAERTLESIAIDSPSWDHMNVGITDVIAHRHQTFPACL